MISLSPFKLLFVAVVILLLMGPDKLPDMAHRIGATWRTIKRLQERMESEVREAIPDLPSTGDIARMARSPVSLLNQLADRATAKEEAHTPADETAANTSDDPPSDPPLFSPPPQPPPPRIRVELPAAPPDPSLN
ncbi:MAG TPA: twin-arginine translocase TatA/TatE family subunit [Acidimicrobiales bacterium]